MIVPYLFLVLACFFDLKERRIPNEITYGMFVCGIAYQALEGGLEAVLAALGWAFVCLGLLAIASKAFRLGGGDVKLAVASAAWLKEYTPAALFFFLLLIVGYTMAVALERYGFKNLGRAALLEIFYGTKTELGPKLPGAVFLALGYIIVDQIWGGIVLILT